MSLDVLARLRSSGQQPAMVCVTTCWDTAQAWAENAGIWPIVVEYGQDYDFSPLADLPVVLALPQLKGPDAQKLAHDLMAHCALIAYDLELDHTSVVVEA